MPAKNVLRWRDGGGWLILSGGGDPESADIGDIEAEALARVQAGDPVAYIWAAGDVEDADNHLLALEELGAPTGYLVDILTEDDDTLRTQLSDAGLIVLGDGPNAKGLRSALPGGALEGMIACYERGGVILGVGQGAAILGSYFTQGDGLNWVEKGIVAPGYDQNGAVEALRSLLTAHPDAYGIGISTGSALALGPDGEVGAWGKGQVTIALGSNYG